MGPKQSRNMFKMKRLRLRCIPVLGLLAFILTQIDFHWQPSEEMLRRMAARRIYLKEQCTKTGLDSLEHNASTWEFLVNRQYHIIWCNVFKAASSSWMHNFNLMANYTENFLNKTKIVPVQLARNRYPRVTPEEVKKAQEDSITFIIVRHPLERLASAYKNKIAEALKKSFHYKLGLKIIEMYRRKVTTVDPNGRERTHRLRRRLRDKKIVDEKPVPKEKYPLFEEFVSYVLDEAKANRPLDMHWTPYTTFCTPCKNKFDLILKFETIEEDQKYLIKLAHLEGVVKAQWKNRGHTDQSYFNNLYSRISRDQLNGLYQLYKYDFQLFNYSIESYYDIVDRRKIQAKHLNNNIGR